MKVLLSPMLTSRFKDDRAKKTYYIPDDVKHTGFNGAVLPPDSEPFKYLFVVLINGTELPTLHVYTGTGLVNTGISTKSVSDSIEYTGSDEIVTTPTTYNNQLVIPNIPLGDRVPCNVVNSAAQLRCILDVQISSLKKNEETGGYDIINRNVSLVQGNSYTFVYSDMGSRGDAKIVKGKIKSITPRRHENSRFVDEYFIEVDASKSNESNIVEIRDIFLYDVQDIDCEYDEDEFAKEEISPDPKYWIDVTDPVVETIVPGGEQPRE